MAKFSEFSFLQTMSEGAPSANQSVQIYASGDDLDQCLYYLRTLSNLLRWSSDGMWAALAQNSVSTDSHHLSLSRISKSPFIITRGLSDINQPGVMGTLHSSNSSYMFACEPSLGPTTIEILIWILRSTSSIELR